MKTRPSPILFALLLLAVASTAAVAGSAPWYKWKNPVDRTYECAQFTPGDNYVKDSGPYSESSCRKPGSPS